MGCLVTIIYHGVYGDILAAGKHYGFPALESAAKSLVGKTLLTHLIPYFDAIRKEMVRSEFVLLELEEGEVFNLEDQNLAG